MRSGRRGLSLLCALVLTASVLALSPPAPADAALPTAGGEVTSFQIDGDSVGPDDWDAPYTAPGLTPLMEPTTGLLPANFFPSFSVADFPDPSVTQVPNPAFGFQIGAPEFCEDNQGNPAEDGWLNPAGDGKLEDLRLEDPVISNQGNVILGCPSGNPQNKTDLLQGYAAFEIVSRQDPGGGAQDDYILYGGWRRGLTETGDLNFYIPVADGVDGPIDAFGYPTNTAGDRVIQFNFDPNNGGSFGFALWGWDTVGGQWQILDLDLIPPGGTGNEVFDAAVGTGNGAAFGEFAFNLTASGVLPDDETAGCRVVEVADYVFTGTGNSTTASLKDYVNGPGFPFTNCGSLNVEKTSPFTPADPVTFAYAVQQVDGGVVFPTADIPATVPPSTTTVLASTIDLPPPVDPFPTDPQGNPQTFTPVIAQPDYQIAEASPPDPWQLISLECTYKDIFSPILDGDGNPTGDFDTVVATYDDAQQLTEFAIPPVLDVNGDLVIDEVDLAAFQVDCVIVNDVNTITIVKDAVPDDATADFDFEYRLGADDPAFFTLNDPTTPSETFIVSPGEANQFLELNAQNPPFWDFTSVDCDVPQPDPDGQVVWEQVEGIPQVNVTIGAGEPRDVTCTFTNTQRDQPYQIVIDPDQATNPLGDPHIKFVELRTDADDDGALDDLVVGATINLTWTGDPGSQIVGVNGVPIPGTNSTTCVTQPAGNPQLPEGNCQVVISSPTNPGSGQLVASFDIPGADPGDPELPTGSTDTTCTNPDETGGIITTCNAVQAAQRIETAGNKTWVGYVVTVTPTGVNPVDTAHTFTITADISDGTVPTTAVPDGTQINFTWVGPGEVTEVNGAPAPAATSCLTVSGACTVTVESADPGQGTLTVTTVEGVLIPNTPPSAETPAPSSDLSDTKTWHDYRVLASADSTNAVGQTHDFTLTLQTTAVADPEDGDWVPAAAGSEIDVSWDEGTATGSIITAATGGTVAPDGLSATCVVDALGQCTVTVQSTTSGGAGVLTAETVDVALPGYDPGSGDGTPFTFDIDDVDAVKTWVLIRGQISAPETNLVGDDHVFTIDIDTSVDNGATWQAAPAGTVVDFDYTGTTIVSVVDPAPDPTSCTLVAGGTCTVTVDSDVVASETISLVGVTSLTVNGEQLVPVDGSLPIASNDRPDGDGTVSTKDWVRFLGDIQPSEVNLVGQDHDFVISAWLDAPGGDPTPVDGGTATFTWVGPGDPTGTGVAPTLNPNEWTCPLVAGTCTVTVTSNAVDSGVITLVSVSDDFGGTSGVLTGVTSTDPPSLVVNPDVVDGQLAADKSWALFSAQVTADDTNLLGDSHTFDLQAFVTLPGGTTTVPAGSTITFTWTGPVGSQVTAPALDATTCTTDATGSCSVTVNSTTTPGPGTIEITGVTATIAGDLLVGSVDDTPPTVVEVAEGSLQANKTWVAFDVDITPATDTNEVGDAHDFLITVQYDDGGGLGDLTIPPDSGTVAWSFDAPDGSSPTGTCDLVGTGTCVVTLNSAVPGTGTLTATSLDVTVDGIDWPAIDLTMTGSGQSGDLTVPVTAEKTWVGITAGVEATQANAAGVAHTFVLSAFYEDGDGIQDADGVSFNYTWDGPAQDPPLTGVCNAAPDANTCTVTVNSDVGAVGTITINSVTVTINGVTFTDIVPGVAAGSALSATKTWVELRGQITPPASNIVGDPHTFTIDIDYSTDDGTTWLPAPAGTVVDFNSSDDALITAVVDVGPDASSCTLVAGGTCDVTVSSDVVDQFLIDLDPAQGAGVTSIVINGDQLVVFPWTSLPIQDNPRGLGVDGRFSDKQWVQLYADVQASETNLVGEDHTFQIDAWIEGPNTGGLVDIGTGTVAFEWNGPGVPTGTGVTEIADPVWQCDYALGCAITVSSDVVAEGTISVVGVITTLGPDTITGEVGADPPGLLVNPDVENGQLTAEKDWALFDAAVTADATNLRGDEHVFDLTANVTTPDGTDPVPDGSTITFTWVGPVGSQVTEVNGVGAIDATTCTTTGGACTVTVDSPTNPGPGTIAITGVDATIAGDALSGTTTGDPATVVVTPDGSLTALKTWVEFDVEITPAEATNLVDDLHTFTITVFSDEGPGLTNPLPNGTTGSVDYSFAPPDGSGPITGTCNFGPAGTCTVQFNSATPGTGTLTATELDLTVYRGENLPPIDLQNVDSGQSPSLALPPTADKTWIALDVDVAPDGINPVDVDHEFTITATLLGTDDPWDATIFFEWPDTNVGAVTGGGTPTANPGEFSCDGVAGEPGELTCVITVSSADPGEGTITVTRVEATVDGDPFTVDLTQEGSGQADTLVIPVEAAKTWVDWRVVASADSTNAIGQAHDFTLTLERNETGNPGDWTPEAAGAEIDVVWDEGTATGSIITAASGGTVAPGGLAATCVVDALGQCVITVESATSSGSGTLTAENVQVSLPGYDPGGGDGVPFDFDIDDVDAVKTWVSIRGTATPSEFNIVGDDHVFDVLIEIQTDGGTWVPAPEDTEVEFMTVGGVGTVTSVVDPVTEPDRCGLRADGTCTVTVSSDVPGQLTFVLSGITSLVVNGEQLVPDGETLPIDDADPSPEVDSRVATKTWVEYVVDVQQDSINLLGDPHQFVISAWYEPGTGPIAVPDGTTITFTWTGPVGSQVTLPAPDATTCTTTGGTCAVTVNSPTNIGPGTLSVTQVSATLPDGSGVLVVGDVAADPPGVVPAAEGQLAAEKTWVDVVVDITPSAVNLTGEPHEFTLTALYDDGDGTGLLPANDASFAYTWTGATAAAPPSPCVAAPATNTCVVTVTSDDVDDGTLTVTSVEVVIDGITVTNDTPLTSQGGTPASTKSWIEFDVDVTPTASNPVDVPHQFTILAQVDLGAGLGPLGEGTVTFTWNGDGAVTAGGTPTANPGEFTCEITPTSDPAGSCIVTVSSADAGSGTITVTQLEAFVDPDTFVVDLTQEGNGQADSVTIPVEATKTWIDWRVTATPPTATNAIDQEHVFSLLLEVDDGSGWVPEPNGSIDVTWAGPTGSVITTVTDGAVAPDGLSANCVVDANGLCEVTVTSAVSGPGTLTVGDVNVSIPGYTPPGDETQPGDEFPFTVDAESADKTWVEFRGFVETDATNLVGDPHTFTIDIEYTDDDGTTWQQAPAGTDVDFTWTGDGAVTAVDIDGPDTLSSCELRGGGDLGTCDVTVSSDLPGSGTLTIDGLTSVTIGGDQLVPDGESIPVSDADDGEDDSRDADKTWIEYLVNVAPDATNLLGDPHTFIITAEVNDGGTVVDVPDGSTITFQWTGPAGSQVIEVNGVGDLDATTCTTTAGSCTVTVDSNTTTGTGTLTVTGVTATIDGTELVGSTTGDPASVIAADQGSLVGTKTWVGVTAGVEATATNLSGDAHIFTFSAFYDDGGDPIPANGATFAYSWTGPNPPAAAGTCVADPAENTCEVVVDSDAAGQGTISIDTVTVTVNGTEFTDVVPGVAAGSSLDATKTWINFDVDVTPATATNRVGDPHTFTIAVQVDPGDGGGLIPLPVGPDDMSTADWAFDAPDGSMPTGTCDLVPGGTCTVQQNSAVDGVGTLSVTGLSVEYDGQTFVVDLENVGSGQAPSLDLPPTAEKTWIELFAQVEATAVNIVGDSHTFTMAAFYEAGGAPQPANGASFAFTWTGAGTPTPTSPCVADPAENTCEVQVTSDVPDGGTITIDSITVDVLGETFTDEVPLAVTGEALSADKTWVVFEADISPDSTNLAGDPHVFTITAQYEDGSGPTPVPDGTTIEYTWTGDGTADDPASCTTTGGTCTVEVTSPTPGSGELEITTITATIDGDEVTGSADADPAGVVPIEDGSLTATKTWIELRATVDGDSINLSGEDHTFVLSAFYEDGTGEQPANGATIDYTWTGDGTADPTASCTADPAENSCEVVVSFDDVGLGTLTIDSITATVDGTEFTDVAAVVSTGGSLEGTKEWIEYDVDITPETAINLQGDDHDFTISVSVISQSAGTVAPTAGTADWEFTAPDGSMDSGTCDLDALGQCVVNQTSDVAGTGTLTVTSVTFTFGGTEFGPLDTTVVGDGQSPGLDLPPTAEKFWIGFRIDLDPETAINLWPAQPEHVVTLTLSSFPEELSDLISVENRELDVVLVSTVATITAVGGGGVIDPGGLTATCITDADGECEVTITSTGPGAATLSASWTEQVGELGEVTIEGANEAEKTWRTYRVTVTPETAENLLGTPHEFTILVEQTDDGVTWTPVEDAMPTLVVSDPAEITSETCSAGTGADGTCTATVESPSAAEVTLSATYIGSVDAATAEFGDEGQKTWIDYLVEVDPPSAENLVDTEHVFTVRVSIDRGGGAGFEPLENAIPAIGFEGVGEIVAETCSEGTDADGECTVTIASDETGGSSVTASFEGTAGDAETGTFSGTGEKTWIDYRISIDPPSATNNVGDPHEYTATLEVDRGDGFGPAADEIVEIGVVGVGGITAIDTAGEVLGTCVTDAAGQCVITVNSNDPGTLTITVTYEAEVGETTRAFSDEGTKTWVGVPIPSTGSDPWMIVRIAAALALIGLVLLLVARRRRAAQPAAG